MPPSGTPVPLGERCTTPYVYDKLVRLSFGFFLSHSVQGTKIDQNIDEGVLIGDGSTIAQSGALNSAIVNLDRVKEIIPWFRGSHKLRLNTGVKVELSRAQARALRKLLDW